LFYPFYLPERFDEAVPRLAAACAEITPIVVTLTAFRFFRHSSRKATLWLAPEPKEDLVRLQAALQDACPDCNDLSHFADGYTPHLSVGQAGFPEEARRLQADWQRSWEPIRFEHSAVTVLRRQQATPFEIERRIPLAATSSKDRG
jgi:2'-5' RNA ligase